MLAPGRVASGEVFAFQHLDWETGIFSGGRLVAREKYLVSPTNLRALRKQFATGYYACAFLFHPMLANGDACWAALDALHGGGVWIGHSRLHHAGWSLKILAADSVRFRRTLHEVRRMIYEATGNRMPSMRSP